MQVCSANLLIQNVTGFLSLFALPCLAPAKTKDKKSKTNKNKLDPCHQIKLIDLRKSHE